MLKSKFLILASLFALLAAACMPAMPAVGPVVTEEPVIPVTGVAVVQSVEIQVVELQPLQVNAIVRGQLPDGGCTTISSVDQVRDGNTFKIMLTTTTDPLAICTLAATPFEQIIPLDVKDLPAAKYIVHANGIERSFKLLSRDNYQFKQMLADSLNARNYDLLRVLMDESLMIGYWQSEGTSYSPELAIEQLRSNLLNSASPITADHQKNLIDLLGSDPILILGSEVSGASPLFVSGLGPEGKDESILFIARQPDGDLYWHGLLFAKDGFERGIPNTGNPPSTPAPSHLPVPVTRAVPTITILGVVRDERVTIQAHDYPADIVFKVRMGKSGTQAIDGIVVDNINSGNGGTFTTTFEIPEKLHGEKQIAIRLESKSGYFSYNWFDNESSEYASNPNAHYPTDVEYVMARQDITIYSGPSKNYRIAGSIAKGQITRVTGISANGDWWRVICPNGTTGSCWVSAKSKFTRPTD